MNKIFVIAFKELRTYFRSALAYIVLVATLTVFNVFFFIMIDQNQEATLRDMFKVMEFMFVFIIPLLTMKLVSEERLTGTLEFLFTTPTSKTSILLGKYFGVLSFYTLILFLTGVYYLILEHYSDPDRLAVFVGYAGLWLEGAMFISIGLMTSSLTRSQIIAAMSSYAIIFLCYFSVTFIQYFKGNAESLVKYAGVWSHSENFFSGILVTSDFVFFVSVTVFFLLLARIRLEQL